MAPAFATRAAGFEDVGVGGVARTDSLGVASSAGVGADVVGFVALRNSPRYHGRVRVGGVAKHVARKLLRGVVACFAVLLARWLLEPTLWALGGFVWLQGQHCSTNALSQLFHAE